MLSTAFRKCEANSVFLVSCIDKHRQFGREWYIGGEHCGTTLLSVPKMLENHSFLKHQKLPTSILSLKSDAD